MAFLNHQLPNWLNFQTFYSVGQAINGMYPDFSFWPLVLMTNWLPFTTQLIVIRILVVVLTFFVTLTTLVVRGFQKSLSFLAATCYSFSGFTMYALIMEYHLGMAIIYAFSVPIVYTFSDTIRKREVSLSLMCRLALCFTIIIYTHLLTAVVVATIVMSYLLLVWFYQREINLYSIKNLVGGGVLTILTSLPIFYRLLKISKSSIAPPFGKGDVTPTLLQQIFGNPQVINRTSISLVALILLLFTLFMTRNKFSNGLLVVEAIIVFWGSNLLPWIILEKLPLLNMIQETQWRYEPWLTVAPLLAFMAAKFPSDIGQKKKFYVLTILAVLSVFAVPEVFHDRVPIVNSTNLLTQQLPSTKNMNINKLRLTRDYVPSQAVNGNVDTISPVAAKMITNSLVQTKNGDIKIAKRCFNNGVILTTSSKIDANSWVLPVYHYKSLNYKISINGKTISQQPTTSKDGFMMIHSNKSLPRHSKISIKFNNPVTYTMLTIMSGCILFMISVYWLREAYKTFRLKLKI